MPAKEKVECLPCVDSDARADAVRRNLGMSRDVALALGQSAVLQVSLGSFLAPSGRRIGIRPEIETAIASKRSVQPHEVLTLPAADRTRCTRIQVCNETTLQAARRFHALSLRPLALNFANGVMPGGGFLSGDRAQEEVLCRSSALHATLAADPMYAYHRGLSEPTSSDWIILSPNVPVFRDDAGCALEEHWLLDFATCAAPYAPKIGLLRSGDLLRTRMARLFSVASACGYENLVLGAWGCGAFANDPARTARDFRSLLEGEFAGRFSEVVFAIADWSSERRTLGHFRDVFSANADRANGVVPRQVREDAVNGIDHPFDGDLKRFMAAQELVYPAAIQELRAGSKRSHWMWSVLPQIEGLGSSALSRQYGIKSIGEARAYLGHPVLGYRLLECVEAMLRHQDASIEAILGRTDAAKYQSCLTLFEAAGGPAPVSHSLNVFYAGARCDKTLAALVG